MNKLPGTTLIPVYQVGGIGITHDIDEALDLFKEFIHRCMSDDCEELTIDSISADEGFSITTELLSVDSYYSSNRYNISHKQKLELKEKYDINSKIIRHVEAEMGK